MSRRARLECQLKRSITLDPTVGSCTNCYRSFNRLVSYPSLLNQNETSVVSRRARLESELNRSITLDPTVRSCLNVYSSFKRLVSLPSQ